MIATLPRPNPDVIFQSVADGAVLLDTRTEVYFGLNSVGARIWGLLPPACGTLDEVCAVLGGDYPEVDEPTLRTDVAELLDELSTHGLLRGSSAQESVAKHQVEQAHERPATQEASGA